MTAPRTRLLEFPQKGEPAPMRLAAIDIGSNSIRQIIADVSPSGSIRVVDEMKAAPRLGAELHRTGMLTEDAMQSALEPQAKIRGYSRRLQNSDGSGFLQNQPGRPLMPVWSRQQLPAWSEAKTPS